MPKLPKKGDTILNVLTREEVEGLLAASCGVHRLAFLLAAFAGLRAGEVRALRMCEWIWSRGRSLYVAVLWRQIEGTPKSGHQRILPLVADLRDALAAIGPRDRSARVVLTAYGKAWDESGLRKAFKRATRRAGLDPVWRFHDLRHFFVTALFRSGVPAPTVQKLAGHADLRTTQRYAHVVQVDLHAAIGRLESAHGRGNSSATPAKRPCTGHIDRSVSPRKQVIFPVLSKAVSMPLRQRGPPHAPWKTPPSRLYWLFLVQHRVANPQGADTRRSRGRSRGPTRSRARARTK